MALPTPVENGTPSMLRRASRDSVLAVDVAFARAGRRSCCVAWWEKGKACSNVHTCAETRELLAGRHDECLHLIVKAPLFLLFDHTGNPMARDAFETEKTVWHRRSGIAVAFSAVNLLTELSRVSACSRICLYEGFMRRRRGASRAADAVALLKASRKPDCVRQYRRTDFGGQIRCIQYYLMQREPDRLPPVVSPR